MLILFMNKNNYFVMWLMVLFLVTPVTVSAYNLGMDVSQWGYVSYFNPAVLGDEDKQDENKEEKVEVKETAKVEKPEKIEIKKIENKTRVEG